MSAISAREALAETPALAARAGVCACVWYVLTGGAMSSWVVGIPAVAVAAYASHALRSRWRSAIAWHRALPFALFFLKESVRGGIDVARRALLPGGRVQPEFLEFRTALPPGLARSVFASTVSLLPGTLAAELEGDRLVIHVLDGESLGSDALHACERQVLALIGDATAHGGGTDA